MKKIVFKKQKENHFYAVRNKTTGRLEQIKEPKIGKLYYEVAFVGGGTDINPTVLEIPIPLCDKHIKEKGSSFGVLTCSGFYYIALSTKCGSTTCRLCKTDLSQPMPYLIYADLSYANLRYANLRYADLSYANLRYADLSDADLRYANLRYADLSNADLRYANLRYADLSNADLSNADLRYADLNYAIYDKYTIGLTKENKSIMRLIE